MHPDQYAQTTAYADPASDRAPGILGEYDGAINRTEEKVRVLFARLNGILSPDYPEKMPSEGVPSPEVSEARTQLQRIHRVADQLDVLLGRLEV